MWTDKKVFSAGSNRGPNMFVPAAAAIGGTWFTEKEVAMATTGTPVRSVATSQCSAAPRSRAKKRKACDGL